MEWRIMYDFLYEATIERSEEYDTTRLNGNWIAFICPLCGALTYDHGKHEMWHTQNNVKFS